MKLAVPTLRNAVDDHFGHCEFYTLYSISEDRKIEMEEIYQAPRGCGCKSNIAAILSEKGVTTMLAGNMGQGALNTLQASGIRVYRGCSGEVRRLVESFLANEISDSGTVCNHHDHGHGNNHEHRCDH